MNTQGINQNEPPTREECERDESMQRPFIWNPTPESLAEFAAIDPWTPPRAEHAPMCTGIHEPWEACSR